MPLSTASDESNIQHHVRHAILKLTHGYVFDFEDCFLRYMVQAAELVHQLKPYAPWLMPICNYGRNEDFVARHHPKLFTPPVRDTMNIFRQPNDPFATYVGVRQHVNDRNMSKAFQKEVYHFEVGIRTQQMLENFIEGNQRQMQFLSDEINRVGNIAMNNNHYLRVLKRHSWKGLRKFHSVEKLRDARITRSILIYNETLPGMMLLTVRIRRSLPWRRLTKFCLSIMLNRFGQIPFQMLTHILRSKPMMRVTWLCCKHRSTLKIKTRLRPLHRLMLRTPKSLLLRVQPTRSCSRSFPFTFCPIIDKKGEKKASIEFRFAAGLGICFWLLFV